ncbi:MAG: hypothetical protein IT342_06425 [Candidatus Melainabacteria bacterium]|nr:hypothetical protein [Candidatus Melainabacteria bacterium]
MSSFTIRFHAVQARAAKLIGELEIHRMVTASDTRDGSEDIRVAGFVAQQHITYASERVTSALRSLRKQSNQPPVITPDDYERFLERCFGIAGGLGVSSDKVAAAFCSEAELALKHAEDAIANAETCYVGTGKLLAR